MNDYDPMSADAKQDPEKHFGALRGTCPVHHFELPPSEAERINAHPLVANPTSEFWSVLTYNECVAVLHDAKRFSSVEGPGPERLTPMSEDGMLLFADDPAHVRQRRIAARAFTPRSVQQIVPIIQAQADDLIDTIVSRGEAELMRDFAVPLTIQTIARIMGVASDRVDDFWRWGNATVAAFGGDQTAAMNAFVAMQELFDYLQVLIDERRGVEPTEGEDIDVITSLLRSDYGESGFTDEETKLACLQLIIAGFETTSTAIGSGIVLLCKNPDQRAKLFENPELIDACVEEIVRYAAPLEGLFRTATADTEIAGCPIPRGAKVRVVYASANHDASQFSDAGSFRVDRDMSELRRHIGFGLGPHSCLGAALARAEMRVAIGTLLRRLVGLELDTAEPAVRNQALLVNGYTSVRIRWDAGASLSIDMDSAQAATNRNQEQLSS